MIAQLQGGGSWSVTLCVQQRLQGKKQRSQVKALRDALLGQHGAPNIAALEQPPQRVVVMIGEFGALCATAQAEGVLDDVLYPLSLILREAGATGVHVLIEESSTAHVHAAAQNMFAQSCTYLAISLLPALKAPSRRPDNHRCS